MQVTVRGKLFPSDLEAQQLDELMRIQSSCMRYAYKRICEEKTKSEIESDLREKFPRANSRYRRDGYFRAKFNYNSALKLVKSGELESPDKIVFGSRKNLKKRECGKISNEEWKQLRNNQLYSRGEKLLKGNANLRLVEKGEKLYLRINVNLQEWVYVTAYLPNHIDGLLNGKKPYSVRILRKKNGYELSVSFEEENREPEFDFEKGAVGVDFNHKTIDLAVVNKQGQLKNTKTIKCPELTMSRKNKRGWLIGNYAKEVVKYAKYWHRGLVIENLKDVARGQQNQHMFSHSKFLENVKRRAEREGVKVKEVNPAYTSVIGKHKYAPYYHITIHQAAAFVVARRGQGLSEHLHGLKTLLLEALEAGGGRENVSNRRVHSWSLWRLMRDLPSRKGADYKDLDQSPETIGVESSGTSSPTERSLGEGGSPRGETATPGSGSPTQSEVVA